MHLNVKRAAAKTLALALVLSTAGGIAPDADAAKKVKLSKSSVTVAKGKSKTVTIKSGKKTIKKSKVKKLTVKSSKTKFVTAKKSGKTGVKVTGRKKGNAKVTVTVQLKGQKAQKLTLKVKVTDPEKKIVDTPAPTAPATNAPAPTTPAETTPAGETPPSGADDDRPTPEYSAAPNPGAKRITNTSDIQNPIINNISIWGMQDNPYAEVGYDYTQYGTYSGIISKWFEAKDAIKELGKLFNPQTAQSLTSLRSLSSAREAAEAQPDAIGTKGASVKSTVQTGKMDFDSKEESDVENHVADFEIRTGASNMENQKLEVVADPAGGDGTALLVTGRAANWHGINLDIKDFVEDPTKDYRISGEVYHTDSSASKKQFYIQMNYKDAEGGDMHLPGLEEFPMLGTVRSAENTWTQFSATYSSKGTEAATRALLAVNWFENNTGDFYLRNIKIMEIKSDKEADASEVLAMEPLWANTEKEYGFSLGGVVGTSSFNDENYNKVLDRHFSSITVDNPLKMYSMLDETATRANSKENGGDGMPVLRVDGDGEKIVKWAYEHGIGVRGHTIVCDTAMSTNCEYFFHENYDTSQPLVLSKEVMLERLESFITQCITYFEQKYPGTIYTWDVVNEAIEPGMVEITKPDGKKTSVEAYEEGDDRKVQMYNNMFYDTIGGDYVEYSFLYARQAVNTLKKMYPERDINIQLFYNDFNCFEYEKRDAIVALAKSIQAFGQSRNMGNLIDGIGMQCYLGTTGEGADKQSAALLQPSDMFTANSIPNAVFMFHDLGCKVQFTELTIRNYDKTKNAAQAEYYKKFMQMAIDINNGTMTKVLE
ncbi:MAG: endo-1,4-beta-xylanase [Roseburia sp.]|nr:endo-1,4-beta-xylanase [Roseburia sp.]